MKQTAIPTKMRTSLKHIKLVSHGTKVFCIILRWSFWIDMLTSYMLKPMRTGSDFRKITCRKRILESCSFSIWVVNFTIFALNEKLIQDFTISRCLFFKDFHQLFKHQNPNRMLAINCLNSDEIFMEECFTCKREWTWFILLVLNLNSIRSYIRMLHHGVGVNKLVNCLGPY